MNITLGILIKEVLCPFTGHITMIIGIYHRSPMQTEKSQPKGKRLMPESRFTEFPALSVGISRSAGRSMFDYFPIYGIKIIKYDFSFLSFMSFYVT